MKYFLDTEFIDSSSKLDLLSIALVAEDGRELYLKNVEADFSKGSAWLRENVYDNLGLTLKQVKTKQFGSATYIAPLDYKDGWYTRENIKYLIMEFLDEGVYGKAKFYGYYASCDFVCLYQLFGTLMEFPYIKYINDIKTVQNFLGAADFTPQTVHKHHALYDARWIKDFYNYLASYVK